MTDYTQILEEFVEFDDDPLPQDDPRRHCFNVDITDDDISEDTESFRMLLMLDPFIVQNKIAVDPAVTEVRIIDTDGM